MKNNSIQVRRRPHQSRAKMTQQALQESFVRLLDSYAPEAITIRQITELAGVGLGTFYEYFSKKEDLIALTIYQHIKNNAEQIRHFAAIHRAENSQCSLSLYLAAVFKFQLDLIYRHQHVWAQIFLLERQVSNIESYRKSYAMMLHMWLEIIQPYQFSATLNSKLALNLQRLSYGFVSQSLLMQPDFDAWQELCDDLIHLVNSLCQPITQPESSSIQ